MPRLDITKDYKAFDNLQEITLVTQEGSFKVPNALQFGIDRILGDVGDGTLAEITVSTWNLWRDPYEGTDHKEILPDNGIYLPVDAASSPRLWMNVMPELNDKIIDYQGVSWFISRINIDAFGTKYSIETHCQSATSTGQMEQGPVDA